jgi:hypothetical protein
VTADGCRTQSTSCIRIAASNPGDARIRPSRPLHFRSSIDERRADQETGGCREHENRGDSWRGLATVSRHLAYRSIYWTLREHYDSLINDHDALERLWRGMARVHHDVFTRLVEAQLQAMDVDDLILEVKARMRCGVSAEWVALVTCAPDEMFYEAGAIYGHKPKTSYMMAWLLLGRRMGQSPVSSSRASTLWCARAAVSGSPRRMTGRLNRTGTGTSTATRRSPRFVASAGRDRCGASWRTAVRNERPFR